MQELEQGNHSYGIHIHGYLLIFDPGQMSASEDSLIVYDWPLHELKILSLNILAIVLSPKSHHPRYHHDGS